MAALRSSVPAWAFLACGVPAALLSWLVPAALARCTWPSRPPYSGTGCARTAATWSRAGSTAAPRPAAALDGRLALTDDTSIDRVEWALY